MVNAQQEPHDPWFFTGVTLLSALQFFGVAPATLKYPFELAFFLLSKSYLGYPGPSGLVKLFINPSSFKKSDLSVKPNVNFALGSWEVTSNTLSQNAWYLS